MSAPPSYPQPQPNFNVYPVEDNKYSQPGYPQPGYSQPGYPQPGYPQPGYPQQQQNFYPPQGFNPNLSTFLKYCTYLLLIYIFFKRPTTTNHCSSSNCRRRLSKM